MVPVETVLATAEPDTVPVNAEPNTATRPGSTDEPPGGRAGEVDDELAGTGADEKGAEDDEHEDEGRADPGDRPEHAGDLDIGSEKSVVSHVRPGNLNTPGIKRPEPGHVGQEDQGHDRDEDARDPSRKLEDD